MGIFARLEWKFHSRSSVWQAHDDTKAFIAPHCPTELLKKFVIQTMLVKYSMNIKITQNSQHPYREKSSSNITLTSNLKLHIKFNLMENLQIFIFRFGHFMKLGEHFASLVRHCLGFATTSLGLFQVFCCSRRALDMSETTAGIQYFVGFLRFMLINEWCIFSGIVESLLLCPAMKR